VRYYLYALVYIVFAVETVFLFPWAVVFRELGLFAFIEMMIFIAILLVGLAYAWKKGALEWTHRPEKAHLRDKAPARRCDGRTKYARACIARRLHLDLSSLENEFSASWLWQLAAGLATLMPRSCARQ
jgi:hypothetical protein